LLRAEARESGRRYRIVSARPSGPSALARALGELDLAPYARRRGQPLVTGEQWHVERLGQRDVGGVKGREVVSQLPDALEQRPLGRSRQG